MQARLIWNIKDSLFRGGYNLQDQDSVASNTLVVIEREFSERQVFPGLIKILSDLPGSPEILPSEPALKDGKIELLCSLEDPGHPLPSHFVWKK